jgi:hypothetical protein
MIATPHHVLKESALAAIGQGKHVLAEKPIAVSEREATTLEEAAAQAGICYMAGYSLRFFDGQRWPAGAQDPRCRDRISPHPRTCQNRPTQQTPAKSGEATALARQPSCALAPSSFPVPGAGGPDGTRPVRPKSVPAPRAALAVSLAPAAAGEPSRRSASPFQRTPCCVPDWHGWLTGTSFSPCTSRCEFVRFAPTMWSPSQDLELILSDAST